MMIMHFKLIEYSLHDAVPYILLNLACGCNKTFGFMLFNIGFDLYLLFNVRTLLE